jgi:hypothetical protein
MPVLPVPWPQGRRFAFTILDDTDDATLENVAPVYTLLRECGLRTTKTAWPLACPEGSENYFAADTLQRPEYLEFVRSLVRDGFELASHGATMESSPRARTLLGLRWLERELGSHPRLYANHGENRENLYWGAKRFQTPPLRWLLSLLKLGSQEAFSGEVEASEYYWGDVFREQFAYARNFTFAALDMSDVNPEMPYTLAATPCVKAWFSTTDAPDVDAFVDRVTREGLDRLEANGGVCIVSTHLGKGFAREGRVDPRVDEILRHVAGRSGWFVPVSELLDWLTAHGRGGRLGAFAQARLELRFLADQLRSRVKP